MGPHGESGDTPCTPIEDINIIRGSCVDPAPLSFLQRFGPPGEEDRRPRPKRTKRGPLTDEEALTKLAQYAQQDQKYCRISYGWVQRGGVWDYRQKMKIFQTE